MYLATAIGIVPGTFVYQFLFAKFGRRILTEGFRLEYLRDPQIWLAIGLFAAFVIAGKWLSKKVPGKSSGAAAVPKESILPLGKNEPLGQHFELRTRSWPPGGDA